MLRRLSLTHRLTLFFTLVSVAMAIGLGWVGLQAVERHFEDLDRNTLQDKRHLIEDILANANSPDDTRWRLSEALNHHHGLHVRVGHTQGEALFASAGFHPPAASAPLGQDHGPPTLQHWDIGNTELHGIRFEATPRFSPASPLDVAIAIDTGHHRQFLAELHLQLLAYAVAATLLSGLLGWLAAHQGMAPLRAMKKRAAIVSAQQLQQRMPVGAVPIEMADLAHELNHMLDRLEQDFQRLSAFSSDLAHELRTPISNLLTQTQVALTTKRDAATYRDILASNAEEFQRLARMVSDMLFLAKTERGVDLPHKERFSARQDALALLEFYEAVAEEKRIRLQLKGDGEVEGDRLMFRRAVSNLLSNALRYTPEAGDITIRITSTAQTTTVAVENTGTDIDAKILPRLFDRFYRADASRAHPDSDGSGLGLAITRAIAEAHGGSVTATSGDGRTCFTLMFPHRGSQPSS